MPPSLVVNDLNNQEFSRQTITLTQHRSVRFLRIALLYPDDALVSFTRSQLTVLLLPTPSIIKVQYKIVCRLSNDDNLSYVRTMVCRNDTRFVSHLFPSYYSLIIIL